MNPEAIATLLERRLAEAGQNPETPVSVAELHKVLLPYHECRSTLGFATKAEYDLALLNLLRDSEWVEVDDELVRAVQQELSAPEPGLAFLKNFAAAQLRVRGRTERAPRPRVARKSPARPPGGRVEDDRAVAEPKVPDPEPPPPVPGPALAQAAESTVSAGSCWKCSGPLPGLPDVRYCPHCGTDQTVRSCAECETELEIAWSYCPCCGTAVAPS